MTDEELFKKSRSLAAKLRKTGRYPATEIFNTIKEIYSAGYSAGYEQQMRMRILDAQERRGGVT